MRLLWPKNLLWRARKAICKTVYEIKILLRSIDYYSSCIVMWGPKTVFVFLILIEPPQYLCNLFINFFSNHIVLQIMTIHAWLEVQLAVYNSERFFLTWSQDIHYISGWELTRLKKEESKKEKIFFYGSTKIMEKEMQSKVIHHQGRNILTLA